MFLTSSEQSKIKDVIKDARLTYGNNDNLDFQIWRVAEVLFREIKRLEKEIEKLKKKSS